MKKVIQPQGLISRLVWILCGHTDEYVFFMLVLLCTGLNYLCAAIAFYSNKEIYKMSISHIGNHVSY